MSPPESPQPEARTWIARAFTAVEDVVYIGLGLLLAGSALTLLVTDLISFAQSVVTGSLPTHIIALLGRILLLLLIVELLYTVQVSFREHALVPEPFLLIGLIAVIRRVLVLTAAFGELHDVTEPIFRHFVIELAVLTGLIISLVLSLVLLRIRRGPAVAERA